MTTAMPLAAMNATAFSFAQSSTTLVIPYIQINYIDAPLLRDDLSYEASAAYLNSMFANNSSPLRIEIAAKNYTSYNDSSLVSAFEDVKANYPQSPIVLGDWSSTDALAALSWLDANNLTAITAYTSAPALGTVNDNYFQYTRPIDQDIQLIAQLVAPVGINGAILLFDDAPFVYPYMNVTAQALQAEGIPVETVAYTAWRTHTTPNYDEITGWVTSAIDRIQSAVLQNASAPIATADTSKPLRILLVAGGISDIELDIFGHLLLSDSTLNTFMHNNMVLVSVINTPSLLVNATDPYQSTGFDWVNSIGTVTPGLSQPTNASQNWVSVIYATRVYNSTADNINDAVQDQINNCYWCSPDDFDILLLLSTAYATSGFQWPSTDVMLHDLLISTSQYLYGNEGLMALDGNGTLIGGSYTVQSMSTFQNGVTTTLTVPLAAQQIIGALKNSNSTTAVPTPVVVTEAPTSSEAPSSSESPSSSAASSSAAPASAAPSDATSTSAPTAFTVTTPTVTRQLTPSP